MVTIFTAVQDSIDQVEARIRAQADADHPELRAALKHLLATGGKRVRPALTLLTGKMFGADLEALTTLAASIELLHTATLVHDDLIDGSLMRRGNPTLNAQWSPAATVLTGDFVFARAAMLAAETRSVDVMKLFAKTLTIIVDGEIKQLFNHGDPTSMTEYLSRIYAKTASMFELATGAAAILSDLDGTVVDQAHRFGYELGIAFQIIDDILDFTGQQTTVGKPVASDLRQGLITLPTIFYNELQPEDPYVQRVMAGRSIRDQELDNLVIEIRESGAIEMAREEAQEYVDRAVDILMGFPLTSERQALQDLASYIVSRHR
jgi:geranylgeranyl pyrophosphate synthase